MFAQQDERREMNFTSLEASEQPRKAANEARRDDPAKRRALAHSETSSTEVEQRRARHSQVKAPLLDLHQMNDKPREQPFPFATDRFELRDQRVIGEIFQGHRQTGSSSRQRA